MATASDKSKTVPVAAPGGDIAATATTHVAPATARPVPEAQLSPEEREIRALKDALAREKAKNLEKAEPVFEDVPVRENSDEPASGILLHFVEDGFTAQGEVWYRGQEIEFPEDGKAYEQTKDRNGDSWVDMDESDQLSRYGRVYFRRGPWPGKGYEDTAVAQAERRRARRAPVLTD